MSRKIVGSAFLMAGVVTLLSTCSAKGSPTIGGAVGGGINFLLGGLIALVLIAIGIGLVSATKKD